MVSYQIREMVSQCLCVQGIGLVQELMEEYTQPVVQAYMAHIQSNAELAVRDMLREIGARTRLNSGTNKLYAEDFLDDGSCIALTVTIDQEQVGEGFVHQGRLFRMGLTFKPVSLYYRVFIRVVLCYHLISA